MVWFHKKKLLKWVVKLKIKILNVLEDGLNVQVRLPPNNSHHGLVLQPGNIDLLHVYVTRITGLEKKFQSSRGIYPTLKAIRGLEFFDVRATPTGAIMVSSYDREASSKLKVLRDKIDINISVSEIQRKEPPTISKKKSTFSCVILA